MKKISMTGKVFIGVPLPVLHMNIIKPFDTATGGDSPKDRDYEETNRIPCTLCFRLLNICQQNTNVGSLSPVWYRKLNTLSFRCSVSVFSKD